MTGGGVSSGWDILRQEDANLARLEILGGYEKGHDILAVYEQRSETLDLHPHYINTNPRRCDLITSEEVSRYLAMVKDGSISQLELFRLSLQKISNPGNLQR